MHFQKGVPLSVLGRESGTILMIIAAVTVHLRWIRSLPGYIAFKGQFRSLQMTTFEKFLSAFSPVIAMALHAVVSFHF